MINQKANRPQQPAALPPQVKYPFYVMFYPSSKPIVSNVMMRKIIMAAL